MTSVDDWLNDEQFDFDVSASPIGEKGLPVLNNSFDAEEDDEEVFFGPQSHKERIAAVVVKEHEAKHTPIQSLSAEEQAMIVKESALLSVRIKHGTPGSVRCSPIAVVHPMRREARLPSTTENKMADKQCNDDKENNKGIVKSLNDKSNKVAPPSKLKSSKILQPKFGLSKGRTASQPEPSTTKLPVSKTRTKIHSEFSEPLVDKVSLYGLQASTVAKKSSSSIIRRRSGIPSAQQTLDTTSKTSSQQPPSLLPSALPASLSRLRAPTSKSTSDVKQIPKGPMRVTTTSQSAIPSSALPQSNLRLHGPSRKNTASTGTPKKNSGKQRSKTTTTPSSVACDPPPSSSTTSLRKRNSLVTPVQRTPSSRKQMTARQLVARERSTSRTPSPVNFPTTTETNITEPTGVEHGNITPATPAEEVNETPVNDSSAAPSHSDILNRYKRLKEKQNTITTKSTDEENVSVETIKDKVQAMTNNTDNKEESKEDVGVAKLLKSKTNNIHMTPKQEATLVDLNHATTKSLMEMSPMKTKDYFLDPFHTGATPPPLIDMLDVLEPERPAEVNLIEF